MSDERGWINLGYTVREGYSSLLIELQHPPRSRIWQNVWKDDSLLKINILFWLMVHENILTTENLQKQGIQQPSRCALCYSTK
jgi:hypothetical protein